MGLHRGGWSVLSRKEIVGQVSKGSIEFGVCRGNPLSSVNSWIML